MIIIRKIEVFICESDKDLRKSYYEKLYDIRNIAHAAANAATAHMFHLDNTIPYLDEDSKQAIQYLGTKGKPASRQNVAYCVMSNLFKDKMTGIMDMLSNLAQMVTKNYNEDRKKGTWKNSLRSYKGNLPIPFQLKSFHNLRFADYIDGNGETRSGCFFTTMGIPFQMRFGRDRSNNRLIVERVINEEYKMCTSSFVVDKNKVFLLLCVDMPQEKHKLKEGKALYNILEKMRQRKQEELQAIKLTKYGQYSNVDFAKCIIFPKYKTTWEGFVPPCKFKKENGDERIVRCLLNYFNHVRYNGLDLKGTDIDEVIAWLEKQSEHPIYNVPSREVILAIWDLGNEWKELTNGCISTE